MRFIGLVFVLVLPIPAQQGMGSTTKAVPRSSSNPASATTPPHIDFQDIASKLGITAPNFYGGENTRKHILEMTGNGVALFDYDNDSRVDVLLVNGARMDGTSRSSVLYRNDGEGRFTDVSRQAGLASSGWAQGVCAGDFDNDGFTDLLITRYGDNLLLRNEKGQFRALPLPSTKDLFNSACTFVDYDQDGLLDLFVSNYVAFPPEQLKSSPVKPPCKWLGVDVFCGPRGFTTGMNHLYHNDGDGRFSDVSVSAGMRIPGLHYGLGATSADFDDDGWPDIYVACDSTPSILYRNNHDGTFTDVAVPAGVAYGDNGEEQGGMGVAAADYDNDGKIDILRSNFIDETTTTLYRNLGDLFFTNQTVAAGHAINTRFVAWGTQFIDVDQDGFKDVGVASGHIYPELVNARTSDSFKMQRLLYWNSGNGVFRDVTKRAGASLTQTYSSRGLATGDLDGDGSPEIVIVNMNAPPTVLKNFGEKGGSVLVKLIGGKSNRSAIGAKVSVTTGALTQTSVVASGSSYLSQSDLRQHFGIGKATVIDRVEVKWPSGSHETIKDVPINHLIEIHEARGLTAKIPFRH